MEMGDTRHHLDFFDCLAVAEVRKSDKPVRSVFCSWKVGEGEGMGCEGEERVAMNMKVGR